VIIKSAPLYLSQGECQFAAYDIFASGAISFFLRHKNLCLIQFVFGT